MDKSTASSQLTGEGTAQAQDNHSSGNGVEQAPRKKAVCRFYRTKNGKIS